MISHLAAGDPGIPGQPKSKLRVLHISTPCMWTKRYAVISRDKPMALSTEMSAPGGMENTAWPGRAGFLKDPEQWRHTGDSRWELGGLMEGLSSNPFLCI